MVTKTKTPYLYDNNRLGDVIAAIQVMGSYGYYKLDFENWAIRISGDKSKAEHWRKVCVEHPEFFRLDTAGVKASLAWRRSYRRRYSVVEQRELSPDEYSDLSSIELSQISRAPLNSTDISVLINTAINLHTRALEQNREHRWLSSPLFSLLGVALGALLGWLSK
ncbi:hypothetical protein [Pseudomonas sp. OA65]|uniref:hypothetical protein n=1 Tax=Pseudomonas sp. OA65 TaxID=2818431 RepID=UPI001A9D3F00|nr:hypothetical protein [Pseudomonas sp. OA65]MBO1537857.1 hypothetical protein [Pseudomonas sp. OA65]